MLLDVGVNSVFSLKFDNINAINAIYVSCFGNYKHENG